MTKHKPVTLEKAFSAISAFVSKDATRPGLAGVLVRNNGNITTLTATDGHTAARITLGAPMPSGFYFPSTVIRGNDVLWAELVPDANSFPETSLAQLFLPTNDRDTSVAANPKYFARAAKILGLVRDCFEMTIQGEYSPVLFTATSYDGTEKVEVLVMPMRNPYQEMK